MKVPLSVYIGYDSRQPIAHAVAAESVAVHATRPVPITSLRLNQLPITRRGLTEFTYSRYLVPYLSGFTGYSLYLDSDTLCRADVLDLLPYPIAYPETAVFVVPHKLSFERPSVMLFNNAKCRMLTPDYVQDSRNGLANLSWTPDIGSIPPAWNHLVGYDLPNPAAKIVHFTKGIPVWPETKDSEFSAEWWAVANRLGSSVSFQELMGKSVHVQKVIQ